MAEIVIEFETKLPPEEVMSAILDFTDRRPDKWPGLAREYYQVYSLGETSADVREGSTKPARVWAREHYDWSTPGKVTWKVQESNFCTPGSGVEMTVSPGADGGSHVNVVWNRVGTTVKGKLIVAFLKLTRGSLIRSSAKQALDRLAERKE